MFPLSPSIWLIVGGLVIIGVLLGALNMQTNRLDTAHSKLAMVKVLGEQAANQAKLDIAKHKKAKDRTDATNKKLRVDSALLSKRLLDARASSGYVPPSTSSTNSTNTASFDRTKLESAIRQLDAEVSGIVEAGDQARIDLNNAKEWAKLIN